MFTKIAGLLIAAVVVCGPMAYADNGSHAAGAHGKKGDLAKILNLTEDQETKLEAVRQKQRESAKGLFDQVKANREALIEEIAKPNPDMGKINGIQGQIKSVQAQMSDNRLNSLLETKKIMTPEQFTGLIALKKEKMLRMHQRNKGGAMHGGKHKHWQDKGDHDEDSE